MWRHRLCYSVETVCARWAEPGAVSVKWVVEKAGCFAPVMIMAGKIISVIVARITASYCHWQTSLRWCACMFPAAWLDDNGSEVSSVALQETTRLATYHAESSWWSSQVHIGRPTCDELVGAYSLASHQCKMLQFASDVFAGSRFWSHGCRLWCNIFLYLWSYWSVDIFVRLLNVRPCCLSTDTHNITLNVKKV